VCASPTVLPLYAASHRCCETVTGRFNRSDDDIPLDLVFYSPFEELRLKAAGLMESKGIHRVYWPSPRSTSGCGTSDGPSLVWATSLWQKLKSSDGSPGLRLPSAAEQLSWLASDHRMEYA
jgi:hypothetical protein